VVQLRKEGASDGDACRVTRIGGGAGRRFGSMRAMAMAGKRRMLPGAAPGKETLRLWAAAAAEEEEEEDGGIRAKEKEEEGSRRSRSSKMKNLQTRTTMD
jgi:hypothetical protein